MVKTKLVCNTKTIKTFDDYKGVYNYIKEMFNKKKVPTIYEMIEDNSKIYIDYECYAEKKEDLSDMRDKNINMIKCKLNAYNYNIFDATGIDGKGRFKVSFRVIFNDLYANGVDMKKFVSGLNLGDYVDYSVYKKTDGKKQLLRLPYTKKEKKEDKRILKLVNNNKTVDFSEIDEKMYKCYITGDITDCVNVGDIEDFEIVDEVKDEIVDEVKEVKDEVVYSNLFKEGDIIELVDLMGYLNQNWDWCQWRKIIWCLRNVSDMCDLNLRALAHKISRESNKYDKDETDDIYDYNNDNKEENKLTIGTLIYMARKNNPEKILNWSGYRRVNLPFYIINNGCLDLDIADYFNVRFGKDFIYCNEIFYYYNKGLWYEDDENKHVKLRLEEIFFEFKKDFNKVKNESLDIYLKELKEKNAIIDDIKIKVKANIDNNEHSANVKLTKLLNKCDKEITICEKFIEKLKLKFSKTLSNTRRLRELPHIKRYIEALQSLLFRKIDPFDNNPLLLGFSNGVYDLSKGIFRDGKKEDYICRNVGYDYIKLKKGKLKECYDIINQIMPVIKERDFLLKTLSTALMGKTTENFIVLTGNGRNGKDTLITKWLKLTLGLDLYVEGNVSSITKKIESDLNVSISNMNKKRVVIYNEPPKGEKLEVSTVKTLTGSDNIACRGLYQKTARTTLHGTHIMLCNEKPLLSETGQAIGCRLFVIPFRSMFRTQSEMNELPEMDYVYPVKEKFKRNEFAKTMRLPLMNILLKYFKIFQKEGYILTNAPKSIVDMGKSYLSDSDEFYNWFCEVFEKGNEKDILYKKTIRRLMNDSEFYNNCCKKEKRLMNQKWMINQLSKNVKLRGYFKDRHISIIDGKKQYFRNCVVGFKIREN